MRDRLAAFTRFFSAFLSSIASWFLLASLTCCASSLHAAELRGRVVSVVGGETLGRVQVAVLAAHGDAIVADVTKLDGSFVIRGLAPGHYTLRVNASRLSSGHGRIFARAR